jgi:flavin reductase (DIM6/NTAB) family NADH-FMN oxidoreductase RutF
MAKIHIGDQTCVLPMATTILGSHLQGRPNFMALGWLTRVNFKPSMLGVAVNQGHASHAAIVETGEFMITLVWFPGNVSTSPSFSTYSTAN